MAAETATMSQADRRLGNALNIATKNNAVAVGAGLLEALTTLATLGH